MSDVIQTPPTLATLREKREQILALAAKHGAYNVRVFGSVARGEATLESDVDFLVNFQKGASLYDLSALRLDLIDLLGCQVDVIEDHVHMRERLKQRIAHDAVVL